MYLVAAEFFLGDFFADAAFDHGRTRDKKLAGAADHQREMRSDDAHRPESGDRTEACADDRDFAEHGGDLIPGGIGGHVGAADLLDGLDAAASAGAVDQPDHGDAQAARELFAMAHSVADLSVGRASADREVVTADHHRDGRRCCPVPCTKLDGVKAVRQPPSS